MVLANTLAYYDTATIRTVKSFNSTGLTGLDSSVLQIKTKIVRSHKADSKPVKQVVNGTVILLPLVFRIQAHDGCQS